LDEAPANRIPSGATVDAWGQASEADRVRDKFQEFCRVNGIVEGLDLMMAISRDISKKTPAPDLPEPPFDSDPARTA